jgi:phage shock protein PspC (stress-responsive transcriptional regulator)
MFVCHRSDEEPPRWAVRLFVAFVIINAAVLAAYLIAAR